MSPFFKNKRLIILLGSFIIFVALVGFSITGRSNLTWTEQFLKDSVGWVQSLVHQPAQYVAGFFENLEEIRNVYEENQLLKSKLDQYVQLSVKAHQLEKENDKLRQLVDKEESLRDYQSIHATVIARNPDQWHELITVNKGLQDGVKQNMAVITGKGMIGKVKFVSEFTSTIQLLSALDRTNRISAVVLGNPDIFGLIEGYDPEKGALLYKKIPFDIEIEKGQVVVSSGKGGVFPSGLVIGTIEDVISDDFGLTQTAYVKPAAEFYNIDHVIIVERLMPAPNEDEIPNSKEEENQS